MEEKLNNHVGGNRYLSLSERLSCQNILGKFDFMARAQLGLTLTETCIRINLEPLIVEEEK
ncbi:MAG: hypothetical protein ABSF44_12400 [Candidatus Bathyarchaeia archaeon]|jgi:hypothetical protein